ncbi:hypothetical protein BDZ89DRAFT_1143386 [Hymenopellis radicata]|nr:hypothetical protein BDZ89DRAFT_1143386 [Hymenopellis radicata]
MRTSPSILPEGVSHSEDSVAEAGPHLADILVPSDGEDAHIPEGFPINVSIAAPPLGYHLYGAPNAPFAFPDAPEMPSHMRLKLLFPKAVQVPPSDYELVSVVPAPAVFPAPYYRLPYTTCVYLRPPEACEQPLFPDSFKNLVVRHPDPRRVVTFTRAGLPMTNNTLEVTSDMWNPHYLTFPNCMASEHVGLSWYFHRPSSRAYLNRHPLSHVDRSENRTPLRHPHRGFHAYRIRFRVGWFAVVSGSGEDLL